MQPELSKKLFRLIKSENNLVAAHQSAAHERGSIATQLSEWGEQTGDDAVSDISDKVGVVLSEIGEQEDNYAHSLDDSRRLLKTIRNIEKSVQPSRDNKGRIADEIAKLKSKEPESTKMVVLEQELVRAEAENLVAEAQLSNVVSEHTKQPPYFNPSTPRCEPLLMMIPDPPKAQRDLQRRVRRDHRARREADHLGPARAASPEAS